MCLADVSLSSAAVGLSLRGAAFHPASNVGGALISWSDSTFRVTAVLIFAQLSAVHVVAWFKRREKSGRELGKARWDIRGRSKWADP